MEISSNNNSIYSTVSSAQTTTTQNTNSSFDTLVNTQEQETIPISKMPRVILKRFTKC